MEINKSIENLSNEMLTNKGIMINAFQEHLGAPVAIQSNTAINNTKLDAIEHLDEMNKLITRYINNN